MINFFLIGIIFFITSMIYYFTGCILYHTYKEDNENYLCIAYIFLIIGMLLIFPSVIFVIYDN